MAELGRVLVTGANGFIGSRLSHGATRGLVRQRLRANQFVGDLLEPQTLVGACADIDTIFHCAGYAHAASGSNEDLHWQVNFKGTQNLISAAGAGGVKRFIFLSSVKAMGQARENCDGEQSAGQLESVYGQAKRAAEQAVLEGGDRFGMHVTNLRLAMVYGRGGKGNLERMARGIKAGWFPVLPETGNCRSLVHVSDVISAIYCAAQNPLANGETFTVVHPNSYSGRALYDAIADILQVPTKKVKLSARSFRAAGYLCDFVQFITQKHLPLNSRVISSLLDSETYSSKFIQDRLGWRAQIDLDAGLKEMLTYETVV